MKKLTNKEFIDKISIQNPQILDKIEIIGEYTNAKTKILCRDKYGLLLIQPRKFYEGLKKSFISMAVDKNKYFEAKAKEVHSNKYDYSEIEYKGGDIKIKIICPIHGVFEQRPSNHIYNKQGCPECYKDPILKRTGISHKNFIEKLKEKQIDIYKEFKFLTEYSLSKNKILVEGKYGKVNTTGNRLLAGYRPNINSAVDKTEYYKNQMIEKYGEKYSYDKLKYIDRLSEITIFCNTCKKYFQTTPRNFSRGIGCKICSLNKRLGIYNSIKANENKEEWLDINAKVYFIKLTNENEIFYKIGITINSMKQRIKGIPYKIEIIKVIKTNLYNACLIEEELHNKLRQNDFRYIPKIEFGGMYECYEKLDWSIISTELKNYKDL